MEFSLWVDPDHFVVRKVQFRNIKSKRRSHFGLRSVRTNKPPHVSWKNNISISFELKENWSKNWDCKCVDQQERRFQLFDPRKIHTLKYFWFIMNCSRYIAFLICLLAGLAVQAQSIEALKAQKEKTAKEISYTNKLLSETGKSTQASLNKLSLIGQQIELRHKMIDSYKFGTQHFGTIHPRQYRDHSDIRGRSREKLSRITQHFFSKHTAIWARLTNFCSFYRANRSTKPTNACCTPGSWLNFANNKPNWFKKSKPSWLKSGRLENS